MKTVTIHWVRGEDFVQQNPPVMRWTAKKTSKGEEMTRIAFLGLGAMGQRMAMHLVSEHDLTVYNRTPSPASIRVAAPKWSSRW